MIGKLKGILESTSDDHVIIDVAGVGYIVFCSAYTLRQLPVLGSLVNLWIETHVREDHIHLYGFISSEEKRLFLQLTKVSGVGSKMGLAILSALTPGQVVMAVASQDKTALMSASGVGPKLAARLLVELKDKLTLGLDVDISAKNLSVSNKENSVQNDANDAVSALVNLGYSRSDAFMVINRVASSNAELSVDQLIKEGLKALVTQ